MNIDPLTKEFLDSKVLQYERLDFVENDPISIPHRFSKKEDVEIAGFLASTIAWGKRVSIIRSAQKILDIMDHSPHDFIIHHQKSDLDDLQGFVHRTFNGDDLRFFMGALQKIYKHHGGLEQVFAAEHNEEGCKEIITRMRKIFFGNASDHHSQKHISNPMKGSAAKRLNMYLRWMVRSNRNGVDFGLWQSIQPAQLSIPLDVHTSNIARKLGLLTRKQNDWKAVQQLDSHLRMMDPVDPVKYDFALFGIGVNGDLELPTQPMPTPNK